MKKLLSVVLFTAMCLSFYSCKNDDSAKEAVTTAETVAVTEITLSEKEKDEKGIFYTDDIGDYSQTYSYYFGGVESRTYYDKQGNKTTEIWYNTGGITCEWYEYDRDGNCIKEKSFSPDGSVHEERVYEYDGDGKCIKETLNYGTVTEHSYDDNGKRVKTTEYSVDGDIAYWSKYEHGENFTKETYHPVKVNDPNLFGYVETYFSDSGDKTKEVRYFADGNVNRWYEWDDSGNLIKYMWYGDAEHLVYHEEYEYDANGNKVKFINRNSKGEIDYVEEYEYDENGNRIKGTGYDVSGESRHVRHSLETEYDSMNRPVKIILYDREGKTTVSYEFKWDNYGNMIEKAEFYANGNVKSTTTLYTYGDYGVVKGEETK